MTAMVRRGSPLPTRWPVENTEYRALYLDAAGGKMTPTVPAAAASVTYDPLDEADGASFDITFDQATELVGHMKLRLFVSTDEGDDLDLFIAVEKLKGGTSKVGFAHYGSFEDGPVALGWLRVSRRALRENLSTPHQPVLAHEARRQDPPGRSGGNPHRDSSVRHPFWRGRCVARDRQGSRHLHAIRNPWCTCVMRTA